MIDKKAVFVSFTWCKYILQVHVFVGVWKLDPFSGVIYSRIGQDQMGAVVGVYVLGGKGLGSVPVDCPGAVVTHLNKF